MPETPDAVQSVPSVTPAAPLPEAASVPSVTENPHTAIISETGAHTPHPPSEHALAVGGETEHATDAQKNLEGTGATVVGPATPLGDGSRVQLSSQPFAKRSFMDRLTDVISLSALRTQIFPTKESSDYSVIQEQFHTERKEHQPSLEERSKAA